MGGDVRIADVAGAEVGEGVREMRRCVCSRVVPVSEWVYPYDCCPDCANELDRIGNDHRAFLYEMDHDRLVDEARD